jgi:cell wall-associated NlpC family hydrolase
VAETGQGVVLLEDLNLRNGRRSSMLELQDAIAEPPQFTLTMDGACTLRLVVADGDRKLTRSPLIAEKSWSEVLGIRFELVAVNKTGDRVTLTYEDGITAELRRRDEKLKIPAGSSTRQGIVRRLAQGLPVDVDPQKRGNVASVVERGPDTNTWDLFGDLAETVHWRRFSTGKRLVFGSDAWLHERGTPLRLAEGKGSVKFIDFDLDQGKRASAATVYLDATTDAVAPGQPVILGDEMGPAAGKWLAQTFGRSLSSTQATVNLTRERHSLKEPKREAAGERGNQGFLPGAGTGADSGGATATAARGRMVAFALAQVGKPYIWGASGPDAYDCSGLVQAATAAAGHTLPKPSASQAAAVARAGKVMSVDTAIRTRGALLYHPGHIVISLGNGSTVEAMGSAYGVCIGSASGRGFTSGGWWV